MNTDNDTKQPSVQPPAEAAASSAPPETTAARAEAPAADPPAASDPLATLTAERDHLKEQLLRTAADFDNYRKRARREMEEARMRGKDDAIRDVLPVIDNLERAVAASENAQSVDSVVEGVRMVLKLFQDTAERMGLNRVPAVGERFDPAMHEAIQQKETDEAPPGTIIVEVTPGYMFGQRLLRAAMVVVARKPTPKPSEPPAAAAEPVADGGGKPPSQAPAAGEDPQPTDATPKSDDDGTNA